MNGRTTAGPSANLAEGSRDDHPTALWASARVTELLGDDETPPPKYGTREWQQLPGTAPQKAAAVITAAEMWRRYGDEDELLGWFQEAVRPRASIADGRTLAELDALAKPKPPHQLRAAPGWPPVAIPGRPGWSRHLVDGQQVDLPDKAQESAA